MARACATASRWVIAVVVTGLVGGCGQSGGSPIVVASGTSSSASSSSSSTTSQTQTQTQTQTQAPTQPLPVSVQSDAAMRRAGNAGPTSAILVPSSCSVSGTSALAAGTFGSGFAPEIYARSGDVIDLYVFTAPQPGYPDGIQLATPSTPQSPRIAGRGAWRVTVPLDPSLGMPSRCVVAAQPTHDFQGAPSAY
jgi:hypothetical protein